MAVVWSIVMLAWQVINQPMGLLPRTFAISTMNAMGFLAGGASLLLYSSEGRFWPHRTAAQIGGGFILVVALGCVAANYDFFSPAVESEVSLPVPDSPPSIPITCAILVCLSLALLTLSIRTDSSHRPSQYFSGILLLVGAVAGTGYLYDISFLYESPRYGSVDVSTAILCIVLGLALLSTHPSEGFMGALLSPAIGGVLLRRLVPVTIGLPIIIGWLRILTQGQDWYPFDFTLGLVVSMLLLILLFSFWYVARLANRIDHERYALLQAWTEQEGKLRLAAAAARIGYWRWMESSNMIEIDQVSMELLGLSSSAPITQGLFVEAIAQEHRRELMQALQGEQSFGIECRPAIDTHVSWISIKGFPLEHPTKFPYRVHGILVDITERRRAQQALQDSQLRLNGIVQSAMDAIITLDQDQNILLFNKSAEDLFRCRAEDALGTPISRFIPTKARERHQAHIMKFQQSDVTARPMGRAGAVSGLRTDGYEFPIEASISKVNVAGQNLCTVILRDISERLQNEYAIREREARFKNMADSAPVMMFITDSDGLCTYLNRQWYEFTGQTEETGLQTGWLDRVYEDDRRHLTESLSTPTGVTPRCLECRVRRRDGEWRWGLCSILSMGDAQSTMAGCITSIVDITDRKRAEQTLQRSAEELENQVAERTADLSYSQGRLRALSQQLTRAEHEERRRIAGELHDYLAQLLVAAHLKLAQDTRPVKTDQDRAVVRDLERILDEALTYTRSLVAKLSPPVLYHLGLPAALQWLAEQMEEHQLIVGTAFDVPPALPKLPDDIAAILFQSVRELLFNVVKHAGSTEAQIALRTTPEQTLVIVVTDQGHGFDASRLDRPAASITSFGLFSIKERMEALGGSIHIHSREGHGTSVTLLCPFRTWTRTGPVLPESVEQDEAASVHFAGPRSTRILLVDDHAMVRQGLRALLERHDDLCVVGEALDGQHACELADALHPDVIIMDANMPRMDGIEATRRIKYAHPQAVIIGLSVQTATQVATSMLQAGASYYLTKESAGDQLYETILQSITRRKGEPPQIPSSSLQ